MSDAAGWSRIEAALDELLALPQAQRAEALARLAGDDAAMRADLEGLLAQTGTPDSLLDQPAVASYQPEAQDQGSLAAGAHLGAWRIAGLIGRGGMGEVYEAHRADGAFELRAAVKLLKRGMDTTGVVDRFNRERRILARLEHPNIAHVLDAGVAPDGRPFLVMEYVEGTRITARSQNLPVPDLLRLFITVCEAVQAAHDKRIVHRDLKPSNVLVTPQGQVKLLDFGIAKALTEEDPDATRLAGESSAMTPAYAAPEQLLGVPVTPASDVYALGVILYQLLVERLPHARSGRTISDIARGLARETVEKPSTALRKDRGRLPEPLRLARLKLMSRDLDMILLKALHGEARRRYATAGDLADELQRLLDHRPIRARPDSFSYRISRSVRRNRLAVSAVAAVITALATGLGIAVWQTRIARAKQADLEQIVSFQSAELQRVNIADTARKWLDHMRERLANRADSDPGLDKARLLANFDELRPLSSPSEVARRTLGESLLVPALKEIEQRFAERPALKARLMLSVAQAYFDLSDFPAANQLLENLLAFATPQLGPDDDTVLEAHRLRANVLYDLGPERRNEAIKILEDVVQRRTRLQGPDAANTLEARRLLVFFKSDIGYDNPDQSERPEAEQLARDATRALGENAPVTLATEFIPAYLAMSRADYKNAEQIVEHSVALYDRNGTLDSREGLRALYLRCVVAYNASELTLALEACKTASDHATRVRGEQDSVSTVAGGDYADMLLASGQGTAAVKLHRRLLDVMRQTWGEHHSVTVSQEAHCGFALASLGNEMEALPLLKRAASDASQSSRATIDLVTVADALMHLHRDGEAQEALATAKERTPASWGSDDNRILQLPLTEARLRIEESKWREAAEELQDLLPRTRKFPGDYATARRLLGDALSRLGRYDEALALMNAVLKDYRGKMGRDAPAVLDLEARIGRTHRDMGEAAQGCSEIAQALKGLRAEEPDVLYIEHAEAEMKHCRSSTASTPGHTGGTP